MDDNTARIDTLKRLSDRLPALDIDERSRGVVSETIDKWIASYRQEASMKNIFAYTANTHPYPEYVSLNQMPDGKIALSVRAPAQPGKFSDKDEGPYAGIELPRAELLKLYEALKAELTPPMMKARGESI